MPIMDSPEGMTSIAHQERARECMREFARATGLEPAIENPRRYLWTDAFAVCTYLGLFRKTGSTECRELAIRLIDQVHHTLGRHRDDDVRTGWISGLSSGDGEMHPTVGGLRIGKSLPERGTAEPYNEQREWDRDGQYYHYLTKWMHALSLAGRVLGNPVYGTWTVELARTAHARFTYLPPQGTRKKMYWKMSIDLMRPLVLSMGQHDPLDGLVTCRELQLSAETDTGRARHVLVQETAEMADIGRDLPLATTDPLGIGGLLFDASRISRLAAQGTQVSPELLEHVMDSALAGLEFFVRTSTLELPSRHRLAFRELGLSIGLAGVERLPSWIRDNPHLSDRAGPLRSRLEALGEYVTLRESIETFWQERKNQESLPWKEHRDINLVMLATSLEPDGFLEI
jgi:hypothetical protein